MRTPKGEGPIKIESPELVELLRTRRQKHASRSKYGPGSYKPAWKLAADRALGRGRP